MSWFRDLNKKQKRTFKEIVLGGLLWILISLLPFPEGIGQYIQNGLFLIPYFLLGWSVLKGAARNIAKRRPFDEAFLMAIATVGAMVLGDFREGVAVMLFYQIGEFFQSVAVGRSRKNITALMDIRPDYANLLREDGTTVQVDPDQVGVGSTITVKPGEKIPIDGTVIRGKSSLDTAALTGESAPREVAEGSEVLSGCINQDGLLTIRTTREFEESTASKILDLVENASSRKSRSENFISKFARYYTPAVVYSALALAFIGPVIRLIMGLNPDWGDWIYRALTLLVISCPCAIVVSIPLSFFGGLGGASSSGILIKGSNYMETLSKIKTIVMDKTGTITKGNFQVSGLHHATFDHEEMLRLAAHAEANSSHPISKSLEEAYGKPIDFSVIRDVREISGQGVIARVDGHQVACGNGKLMDTVGINFIECHSVGSIVHMAVDGAYAGHIVIADQVKESSKEAIDKLKKLGVSRQVMLTGDSCAVAENIANQVGISEVRSQLLPQDKVSALEDILSQKEGKETVAFVGDGINDAPVLTRADIGIAMGAMGSDAAIEAADVVLMDDDPVKIAKAIRIARKCMRIVYENLVFAIGVKLTCLVLGALGIANMWLAIFADVGVMVICVINAVRVLFVKKL
ncbi:heavy metal translocating P-type ATPase [Shuttleworthella satelles]|uniref:heavy metal translocating P-type ATPase n=1 Tax=Shuttleworthella satelles TaxID=177972 RepID=UPI0028D400DF|nr:heavy metal translocating P-type ATPase [Shuttleworthia satelles]